MSHSNAYVVHGDGRSALGEAEAQLRAAAENLCSVVASIAVARGWETGAPYVATEQELPWHDRIRRIRALVGELKGAAADVR